VVFNVSRAGVSSQASFGLNARLIMSWGTELWDQDESLTFHTQKGLEFLEKYGHFIKDRCAIENEYASKLRRLVKSYQPKKEGRGRLPVQWVQSIQDDPE